MCDSPRLVHDVVPEAALVWARALGLDPITGDGLAHKPARGTRSVEVVLRGGWSRALHPWHVSPP